MRKSRTANIKNIFIFQIIKIKVERYVMSNIFIFSWNYMPMHVNTFFLPLVDDKQFDAVITEMFTVSCSIRNSLYKR